jgi:riboflavin synthase
MFTGLVEKVGKVLSVEDRRGQRRITVKTGWSDLQNGESISVNGVCLTVAEANPKGEALFFVSEESLDRSNLNKLEPESSVNLERALTMASRMGGHWVQGHVDVKGLVLNLAEGSDHHKMTVALDPKYGRYCVEKGSIAIDGVSLTINALIETKLNEFMITFLIVPHTWKHTTFSELKIGSEVNVEVDILAKYIERLCPQLNAPLNSSETADSSSS